MVGRTLLIGVMAAACAGHAWRVDAQVPGPRRPSNGWLFMADQSAANATRRLDLTFAAAEGYDADTRSSREEGALVGGGLGPAGAFTVFAATADYARRGRIGEFRASGASTWHNYQNGGDLQYSSSAAATHTAVVGFSVGSRRTRLSASHAATYASSVVPELFASSDSVLPGTAPAPSFSALNDLRVWSLDTGVTVTRTLTARSDLSVTADYARTDVAGGASPSRTSAVSRSRVEWVRRAGSGTSTNLAYVFRTGSGDYNLLANPGQPVTEHGVEIGVDRRHALSATRQFGFRAHLGASTIGLPALIVGVAEPRSGRYGQMSGQIGTDYDFGRSWRASGTYRRGIEYVAAVGAPVWASTVTTTLDGLVTRRIDVFASAAYSSGASALNRSTSVFDIYTGTLRVRYAATRLWAPYAECLYYVYDSRGVLPLTLGVPPTMGRRSVRAGIALRGPSFRR